MNRTEKNLRNRLNKIENELKNLEPDTKNFKQLLQEHREIVRYLDKNPMEIKSLGDVIQYNRQRQSTNEPIRPILSGKFESSG